MHTLSLNFKILQICGLWRPLIWSSGWKFVLYNFYTAIMILSVYTFTMSELIELFASFDTVEKFVHRSYKLLTMIGVCGKMFIVVKKRKKIIEVTNVLKNDVCRPRNADEMKIRIDCERDARWNSFSYTVLGMVAVLFFVTLRSLIVDSPKRNMAFESWIPYQLHKSSEIGYWVAYLHQLIAHSTGGLINSSFDTLVPGLMIQTCAQMKILKYRIEAIPRVINERRTSLCNENGERRSYFCNENGERYESASLESELLSECIRHHVEIFRFSDTSNDIFGPIVFLQFIISSVVLCLSVYEMSKINLISSEFATISIYLTCMLIQIFIYCFYGGELTLQSIDICDAIYRMDWFSFGIRTKKSLMIIMVRSRRPIKFTCANVIVLSLDSFNSLIKFSYSAYNVLSTDH